MSHPDYGNTAGISYPSYDKSLCMAATGSRPKRSWDKEDEALLIDLREGHPDKTWIDICEKFNAAVPPLRYRTVDSITGKWKHMHDRCRNEATPKKTKKMEDSSEVTANPAVDRLERLTYYDVPDVDGYLAMTEEAWRLEEAKRAATRAAAGPEASSMYYTKSW